MDIATLAGLLLAAFGLILTGVGLVFTGKQLRASQRVAAGEFLLHLDQMLFEQHHEVHQLLRPGGAWETQQAGPSSTEDWIKVERYMGMFERIKVLLDYGLLEINTVESFYGYRIRNIVANKTIVREKHLLSPMDWKRFSAQERKKHPWKHFIELWHSLEKHREAT
jgi:hypothetical protein